MKAGTSASFSLIVCFLIYTCSAQTNITAKVGGNVILPCKVPISNETIATIEWSRPGLGEDYFYYNRSGLFDPDSQHPSYKNRVDLQDKEMKDGDVSLNLTNVMMNDTGTYEGRVYQKGKNEPIDTTCSIYLEVLSSGDKAEITGDEGDKDGGKKDVGKKDGGKKDGGDKDGGKKDGGDKDGGKKDGEDKDGLIVGPIVAVIVLLAVAVTGFLALIGVVVYERCMKKNSNLPVPTNEPESLPMSPRSDSAEPSPPSAPLMDPPAEEETEM